MHSQKLFWYHSNGASLNPEISLFSPPLSFFDFFFAFPSSDTQYNEKKTRSRALAWRPKHTCTATTKLKFRKLYDVSTGQFASVYLTTRVLAISIKVDLGDPCNDSMSVHIA